MRTIRSALVLAAMLAAMLFAGARMAGAQPVPPKPVQVTIVVIEADKKAKEFDPRAEQYRSAMPGYTGAKVLDELSANTEEGSSVSLEIAKKSGTPRLLKVTVKKVDAEKNIRLRIGIDALNFHTETTHKKGAGTVVVAQPLSKEKALFLAITPKTP